MQVGALLLAARAFRDANSRGQNIAGAGGARIAPVCNHLGSNNNPGIRTYSIPSTIYCPDAQTRLFGLPPVWDQHTNCGDKLGAVSSEPATTSYGYFLRSSYLTSTESDIDSAEVRTPLSLVVS